jgi:hypothetical protein
MLNRWRVRFLRFERPLLFRELIERTVRIAQIRFGASGFAQESVSGEVPDTATETFAFPKRQRWRSH